MNELYGFFQTNKSGRQINKWRHYFEIYETYFSIFRNKPIVFLEIGVQNGGSYKMFREYFGEEALFFGIDLDPRCKEFEEEGFKVFIGSQQDSIFLNSVIAELPMIDIILDDGGHTMLQQIISFEILFNKLKPKGVYLVEDTHTSYINEYGGGYKRIGTFIEYSKKFADVVNGFHINSKNSLIAKYKNSVKSVHFYDSIVVFIKDEIKQPFSEISGSVIVPYLNTPTKIKVIDKIINKINLILAFFRLPSIYIQDNSER